MEYVKTKSLSKEDEAILKLAHPDLDVLPVGTVVRRITHIEGVPAYMLSEDINEDDFVAILYDDVDIVSYVKIHKPENWESKPPPV